MKGKSSEVSMTLWCEGGGDTEVGSREKVIERCGAEGRYYNGEVRQREGDRELGQRVGHREVAQQV